LAAALFLWVQWSARGSGVEAGARPAALGTGAVAKSVSAPLRRGLSVAGAPGFRVAPGFRIELVAAEPLVTSPSALAFDERGRLFVLESSESVYGGGSSPALGRIRVLDEADEKGVFQASAVYADQVPRASALACYGGGVFVAAAPDLLYFKDRTGGASADLRQVVLTGFGAGTNSPGKHRLPNNFNWGLDHRIHAAGAGLVGTVLPPTGAARRAVSLDGHDFAFDPRTLAVVLEAGHAESSLSFDASGRRWTGDLNRPLLQSIFEPRYYARNPWFPAPPEMVDAADPATRIFRWGEGNRAPVPEDRGMGSGGLVSGWLTAARGFVFYRGGLFPSNYLDNCFIPDPESHLIHRVVLHDRGLTVDAHRAADERGTEFLIATDPAFRPWQLVNGPDGALYVADHRVDAGQGRIYRIVPEHAQPSALPKLDKAKTVELIAALAQGNGWAVDTAGRLLYERQDPAAEQWLTNVLRNSKLPLARLRALHGLEGQGRLRSAHLLLGLNDSDPRVRECAVALLEKLAATGPLSVSIWDRLQALARDDSIRVRYQLALTLGNLRWTGKGPILAVLLGRDLQDPWVRAAILSSQDDGAGIFLVRLAVNRGFREMAGGWQWIEDMAEMIGVRGRIEEVAPVISFVDRDSLPPVPSFLLLSALGEGLRRTQSSLAMVDSAGRLQRFYKSALTVVVHDGEDWRSRVAAARLLGVSSMSYSDSSDWLRAVLAPTEPPQLQSTAMAALGRFDHPRVAADLLLSWRILSPPLRTQAGAALLGRVERVGAVLDAIEAGRIGAAELAPAQVNFLRANRDPAIRARARKLLGPFAAQRPVAEQQFRPAARMVGVATQGRAVFRARCAACHQMGGEGQRLGPDLDGVRAQSKDRILDAILEPNLDVSAEGATTVLETRMGDIALGVKAGQTPTTVTLRQPGGVAAVWARDCVQSLETQPWSLMPEGLEQGLAVQDMADLLEFLATAP